MNSPFKFLDAYAPEDKALFFGRDKEVAELYDMVTKNRLILIYGQSGTGKTSLVQCGLAGRFDATDWYPISIRRQTDLNRSLEQRLLQASGSAKMTGMAVLLDEIYVQYLRPVYLIFDQLEELFILGTPEEQTQFVQNIRAILDAKTPCRIVFVIREEYLVYLYELERVIPNLFDRRIRVEPMGRAKVKEVLNGSFQQFNIAAEPAPDETYEQIIQQVSGGKGGIQLPFLQVWLDRFYKKEFEKKYPEKSPGGSWPALEFSRKDIRAFGGIEEVLDDFLQEQKNTLEAELKAQFPEAEENGLGKVLDAFVSEEGTKRPIGYEWRDNHLQIEARWAHLFKPLTPAMLAFCCRKLEQARLLRFSEEYVELAHDALAALIDGRRSQYQRRLSEAYTRLLNNHREFLETGEYLSRRQLNSLEEYLPQLSDRMDARLHDFVAESFERATKAERAELEAERRKKRQARRIAVVGFLLAALALAGLFGAVQQYRAAARNAAAARRSIAVALKVEGKYPEALVQLQEIGRFATVISAAEKEQDQKMRTDWDQVQYLVAQGDSLARIESFRTAETQYAAAQKIAPDAHLEALVTQTQKDLEAAFRQNMLNGETQMLARRYDLAKTSFEKALLLKPGDVAAERKLAECARPR